jgi:flagellar hook-associated protein 1 FlgK
VTVSGTFSSLSSALSALRYNQVAMDVASGNVANAGTTGYARRQAIGQATGAPAVPAMWSTWNGAGDGVEASKVSRMVDPMLDSRSRTEHASSSFLDTRQTSLTRFETALGEPGHSGVAAALADFKAGWHDVSNNPGDPAARSQLLARAQTLQSTIAAQAGAVSTEWSDQRTRLDSLGSELNQVAGDLAQLNQGLRSAYLSGTDAGTLLDQRDQLTMRLSELAGGSVTVNPDSTVDVSIAGHAVVQGNTATAVTVSGSADLAGATADPVTLSIGGTPVTLTTGEVGGTQQLLGQDLPGYMSQLDGFVATLASSVNTQHQAGVDLAGNAGGAFFTGTTATTLQVAITDTDKIAAAAPGAGTLDNTNADTLGSMDLGDAQYRKLVTSFGVTVSSVTNQATNQDMLTSQVDASRESLSGINIDEEMVNLLAAQRGYEGASRVLTTMDSMLDTLINRTGLTR